MLELRHAARFCSGSIKLLSLTQLDPWLSSREIGFKPCLDVDLGLNWDHSQITTGLTFLSQRYSILEHGVLDLYGATIPPES